MGRWSRRGRGIERVNPSPSQTAKVDAFPRLLARGRACDRMRRIDPPTLLAVNFYDAGDVLGVVNVLNGLPRDAEPKLPTRRLR